MNDPTIVEIFEQLFNALKAEKPNDRSEVDRSYAILLTELEKAYSYFIFYIHVAGRK